MTRSCLVISVKTIVNFVPLKKSDLETLNQYLHNILNGHRIQFRKLSVQNIEENVTSRAAIFRTFLVRFKKGQQNPITILENARKRFFQSYLWQRRHYLAGRLCFSSSAFRTVLLPGSYFLSGCNDPKT